MASKQQTRANRKNAQHSTGPRTAAGKAKSSQNALKHGLRAQATVLPDEDLDEFELLVSELEDQFQPQSAIEWTLLRQLADAEWRMRRVPSLEAALLAAKMDETVRYYQNFPERLPEDDDEADMVLIGKATERDANNGDTLSKLSRYEARLSHRYFKVLEQLQRLQSLHQREAQAETQRPQPAPDGGSSQIAAGDPSPVRKGRVHTERVAPAAAQPQPAAQADTRPNQPSAQEPTANKRDRSPGSEPARSAPNEPNASGASRGQSPRPTGTVTRFCCQLSKRQQNTKEKPGDCPPGTPLPPWRHRRALRFGRRR